MFAEERRRIILEALERDGRVLVDDLSRRFGMSKSTLRNDLSMLEQEGFLQRAYGGAVRAERHAYDQPLERTVLPNFSSKQRIGRRAAQLVSDGDVLFCDSGSTVTEFVKALAGKRGLTIITNDLMIAFEAERAVTDIRLIFVGGTLRQGYHYMNGAMAVDTMTHFMAPAAYLSASGFTESGGFSCTSPDSAELKRVLIKHSDRRIMLMDTTKMSRSATTIFASLSDIDTLVTDSNLSKDDRKILQPEEGGPELIVAT